MATVRKLALLTLAALPLPATAGAQAVGIQPGQWEIAVTINSVDMPGAPAGIAQMMVGKTTKVNHCVTPEDAAKGPQELMKSSKNCTFTKYDFAGGRLSSEMTCKQGSGSMTAVSSGTFTPTTFSTTGRSVMTGGMAMTMTSTSVGRRLGDCK